MFLQDKRLIEEVITPHKRCGEVEPESHEEMRAQLMPISYTILRVTRDLPTPELMDQWIDSINVILEALEPDTRAAFACALDNAVNDVAVAMSEVFSHLIEGSVPPETEGDLHVFHFQADAENPPPFIQKLLEELDEQARGDGDS